MAVYGIGCSVGDARDAAAIQIENRKRLEDVVELAGGERDGDRFIAADTTDVLEITDAVLE